MAKLCLLFIAVFCAVQLSMAGRIVRDAETSETPAPDTNQDNLENIKKGLTAAGETISSWFTQENLNKAFDGLKEAGKKLGEGASELGESASKTWQSAVDTVKEEANKQS